VEHLFDYSGATSMPRIYVSIDAEGLPGIFSVAQLTPKAPLFSELRKIMLRVVSVTAEELQKMGYEVWVADSHGFMGNIDYTELPDNITLIRGSERAVSMVTGIDRGFDAAIFLGYHSAAGTMRSVADHTYSGLAFFEVRINGERASEFYFNALVAGHFNVPVVLVSGDDKLREEVLRRAPWVEYVVSKESLSRSAAIMKPLNIYIDELRAGIRRAVENLKSGKARPLKIGSPIIGEFVFRRPEYADNAENIPGIERIDAYTVRYTAKDIIELYRVKSALSLIAYAVDAMWNALR